MMTAKYCFWSVCTGEYGALMENCVRTAREAGVFKEFHVLCDQPVAGCECYDALQCDKSHGLFKLHYLKAGISRLPFDFFVWVDADTVFSRNPLDLPSALGRSPIHVPLEASLTTLAQDHDWRGISCFRLRELLRKAGVANHIYISQSAFWIVRREAIETVYELGMRFWHLGKEDGLILDVSAALGYAMQMLCGYPESHLVTSQPSLWASDDTGRFNDKPPDGQPWEWRPPLHGTTVTINPAIIHLASRTGRSSGGASA